MDERIESNLGYNVSLFVDLSWGFTQGQWAYGLALSSDPYKTNRKERIADCKRMQENVCGKMWQTCPKHFNFKVNVSFQCGIFEFNPSKRNQNVFSWLFFWEIFASWKHSKSTQVCDDDVGSYMTSAVFPGLGLLLSLDRLTSLAKEERTPHFGYGIDASPLAHQRSENLELGVTWIGQTYKKFSVSHWLRQHDWGSLWMSIGHMNML